MKTVKFDFTRQRIFPGFDGKFCKTTPRVAFDGDKTAFITYNNLLLTGSDVVYGTYAAKSADRAVTFDKPVFEEYIKDTYKNGVRTSTTGEIMYNKVLKRWYALGYVTNYENDARGTVNGDVVCCSTVFLNFDPETKQFTGYKTVPFPFEQTTYVCAGNIIECDNGDIIIPFYMNSAEHPKMMCVAVRYRFTEDGLEIAEAGSLIESLAYRRGIGEPSLIYFKGKYYMTVRCDDTALYAESDDGLHFGELKLWKWENGEEIGCYNTQQHWIASDEGLFLCYTRKGAHNDHVFRNRAPLFMAQFDTENGCLVKETEIPLVPELGARLGNFWTINVSDKESWLITAEWMQPIGCEKYGSDNSIWLVKLFFE